MEEFRNYLLGDKNLSYYAAALLFCIIGLIFVKVVFYKKRTNKEESFSLYHWVGDNWRDVVIAITLSFLMIRFTREMVYIIVKETSFDTSVITDKFFYHIALGAFSQKISHYLRKFLNKPS